MNLLALQPSPNLIKLLLLAALQSQSTEQILLGFIMRLVVLVEECLSQRLVLQLLDQGLVNVQLAYMEEDILF